MTMLLTLSAAAGAASGGHGGDDHGEVHEPVPTGAALTERCAEYAETLAFTRAQLKKRNLLGRWNFVVSEHRKRERFHDRYCSSTAMNDHGPDHGAGHDDSHDEAHDMGVDDHHG